MLSMKSLLNAPGDGLMKHLREECVQSFYDSKNLTFKLCQKLVQPKVLIPQHKQRNIWCIHRGLL